MRKNCDNYENNFNLIVYVDIINITVCLIF